MRYLIAAAVLGCAMAGPAWAEKVTFHATLDGASEVPPKTTSGKGQGTAALDTTTRALSYTLVYQGLTGPATMAHIHGPAAVGANAPVVIPFVVTPGQINGSVTLTDSQVADLTSGKYYMNVHTAANPAGEIRGQMIKD